MTDQENITPSSDEPKIQIDSDWKEEAQREKDRLAEEEATRADAPAEQRGMPEASFKTLMGMLASQAIMGLGAMADPETKRVVIDLEGAKFNIDMLAVVQEKTKGNLSPEEETEMTQVLSELQSRFVQIAELVAQQAASGNAPAGPGGMPPGAPGIIEAP